MAIGRREEAKRWRAFVGEVIEALEIERSFDSAKEFTQRADAMARSVK